MRMFRREDIAELRELSNDALEARTVARREKRFVPVAISALAIVAFAFITSFTGAIRAVAYPHGFGGSFAHGAFVGFALLLSAHALIAAIAQPSDVWSAMRRSAHRLSRISISWSAFASVMLVMPMVGGLVHQGRAWVDGGMPLVVLLYVLAAAYSVGAVTAEHRPKRSTSENGDF